MKKPVVQAIIFLLTFGVVIAAGIGITYLVANSDLPLWLKIFLLR